MIFFCIVRLELGNGGAFSLVLAGFSNVLGLYMFFRSINPKRNEFVAEAEYKFIKSSAKDTKALMEQIKTRLEKIRNGPTTNIN